MKLQNAWNHETERARVHESWIDKGKVSARQWGSGKGGQLFVKMVQGICV